jgi:hypothetical protein
MNKMKQYYALRIIAAIIKLVGWVNLFLGAICCMFALSSSTPSTVGMSLLVTVVIAVCALLIGLIFISGGQLVEAVADIATNSAHIDGNTAKTVEVFERMSGNVRRREPELN